MKFYRLLSHPEADLDIESSFGWYERERAKLGIEFLEEVAETYERVI